jgi:perosamine synthetase
MAILYPVYNRSFKGNELLYVKDCLESTWISSKGSYIEKFETKFAEYTGAGYATTVNNGTAALHLALMALGIGDGDEVIVPDLTYVATPNAVRYTNAIPVFADVLTHNWQIDPADIERKITPKTIAVLIVHLYGAACNMDEIVDICEKHKLLLIEDCAEGIGTFYKGKHVGTFGDIAAFSFFGNKTITTGEGGMVISNNKKLIDKASHIKNQGVTSRVYWHDIVGYNYRMTNICAAIGLAQLEYIDDILANKTRIARCYRDAFNGTGVVFHEEEENTTHSYWMCSVLIKNAGLRDRLFEHMREQGIDSRPLFYPCHTMPMYKEYQEDDFPVTNNLSYRGMNLPSYPELTNDDVKYIANTILNFLRMNE